MGLLADRRFFMELYRPIQAHALARCPPKLPASQPHRRAGAHLIGRPSPDVPHITTARHVSSQPHEDPVAGVSPWRRSPTTCLRPFNPHHHATDMRAPPLIPMHGRGLTGCLHRIRTTPALRGCLMLSRWTRADGVGEVGTHPAHCDLFAIMPSTPSSHMRANLAAANAVRGPNPLRTPYGARPPTAASAYITGGSRAIYLNESSFSGLTL